MKHVTNAVNDETDWKLPGCGTLFFYTFWALSIPLIAFLVILLLSVGITTEGKLVAIGVTVQWVTPAFSRIKWHRAWTVSFAIVGFGFLTAAWARTPPGENPPTASIQSHYRGSAGYHSWVPSQLVPEVDQHLMGSHLFTAIDPFIDQEQADRIRGLFLSVYEPMRADPEFHNLGNALGQCYADMFLGPAPTGHCFVYKPSSAPSNKALPVILFLHGSMGNFKGNLWVWKQFADRNQFAIVAPTFGEGNWNRRGGAEEIKRALDFCLAEPNFDSNKIYLAGLSNGGLGVTEGILYDAAPYRGFIYLSPVLQIESALSLAYQKAVPTKPIFVMSGEIDRRIPASYLRRAIQGMKKEGLDVESHFVDQEDHFLFFSNPELIWQQLEAWLSEGRMILKTAPFGFVRRTAVFKMSPSPHDLVDVLPSTRDDSHP